MCWRAGRFVGALLPLVLILVLLPEPIDSQADDYLPSSRVRVSAFTIVKSLKPCQGENAGPASRDFAVGGFVHSSTICQSSIDAESHLQLRHFSLLTNRLVRSPPTLAL
ncbi:MAG: hypothetical protein ACREPG_11145 [Candidatus Binatia bacterium]